VDGTYESDAFIVTVARDGDTAAELAARHLGDAGKAWMIEDFAGSRTFTPGQRVVIPRQAWNLSGVTGDGYQLVPILVYHNLGAQPKGRLVLGAQAFEQQMRYLKAEGYRVIALRDFLEFARLERQLPRRAVVLTFDDGYRSFREFAYPVLRELGFPATLFVYTDYVGAGRNALSWKDLQELAAQGFDIQPHSKTHVDLRRARGESSEQYTRRMQAELGQPQALVRKHLGTSGMMVAYPYGWWDEDLLREVKSHGYVAAFTVLRQGSPAFVDPLRIHRSQIYAEMSLEEFARNLDIFQQERLR
jgi:peptidoglycan/xylan/chitin deacetylase (PgdA/CDA1 family)